MDELEFKNAIRQVLVESREKMLNDVDRLLEYGDEFGDVDLGGWKDLMKVTGGVGDVAKTVMGSVSNISNKARTLLSVVYKGLKGIVLPFVKTEYENIYKAEARRHSEIMRMYPEIFAIARNGFPEDGELFAFMLNPVLMTSWVVGRIGGDVALDLTDALSGQSPDVITRTRPLRRRVGTRESLSLGAALLYEDDMTSDLTLDKPEDKPRNAVLSNKRAVKQLLDDNQFQKMMNATEPVQKIVSAARNSKNETLNDVINMGRKISEAQSVEDLRAVGIDLKLDPNKVKQLEDEGLKKVVSSTKKMCIETLAKRTAAQRDEFENMRIPEDSDVYKVYGKTIKRLEQLLHDEEAYVTDKHEPSKPGSNGGVKQPPPVA